MKHPILDLGFVITSLGLVSIIVFPFGASSQRTSKTIIPYADTGYRYKITSSGNARGFERADFDESEFESGDAPFGTRHEACPSYNNIRTRWPSGTSILVRKTFNLPKDAHNVKVGIAIDNDVRVYINGRLIGSDHHEGCARRDRFVYTVPDNFLIVGRNVIAAIASDDGRGASYLDLQVTAEVTDNSYSQSAETVTSQKGIAESFGRRSGASITKMVPILMRMIGLNGGQQLGGG